MSGKLAMKWHLHNSPGDLLPTAASEGMGRRKCMELRATETEPTALAIVLGRQGRKAHRPGRNGLFLHLNFFF